MTSRAIRDAVAADLPRVRAELDALVRIPSVSAPGFPGSEVRRSASFVVELLEGSGVDDARMLEIEGAHPAVYGVKHGPAGSPTVLLYAHHDVQPAGPDDDWDTDPFEPVEVSGRLFGRGAADDKAGIMLHLASLRAFGDDPPVTIKFLIEGEEEIGSRHLEAFLDTYAELLDSDAIVIGDSGNWREGTPTFTTSLRGLVECVVTVRTLRYAVHSGSFGGIYPDALSALARMLAALHNDDGTVAVPGLVVDDAIPLDLTLDELDEQMLPVDGLEPIGVGSITSRLWRQPTIAVVGLDAIPVDEAINQIVPAARAKISVRVAPGQDIAAAMDAVETHLENAAPWGAEVSIERGGAAEAFELDTTGRTYEAYRAGMRTGYGSDPIDVGVGGSIPFVAGFSKRYPDADILMVGVADPTSRYHGPNESVSLADLESAIVSQAEALRLLGS